MFKVTIWCKVPVRSLSHGIQALIPDSIAATFSTNLSSRGVLEEQTTYQNPDVAVFTNHGGCDDSSVIVGVKFICKTNMTDLARIYAIIRAEFARTLKRFGVGLEENALILSITPASDTYNNNGFWSVEQSDSLLSSWQTRLGDPPSNLMTVQTTDPGIYVNPIEAGRMATEFMNRDCNQYMLMGRSNRLPGLDRSHQVNTDTGLSQDITRGGTIDPNNNPNPDYLNPNPNRNPGLSIPLIPIVGGVVVLGILTAVYLNQKSKQKTQ